MRTIELPARLDNEAVRLTAIEINEATGSGPVRIDASGVAQIGMTGLQLLLSAQLPAVDRFPCTLFSPSDALRDAAHIAGLDDLLTSPWVEVAA